MEYFHIKNGHKGYLVLGADILHNLYYFNNLYKKCNTFIKKCIICIQNNKNTFKIPAIIQIIPNGPRDVYQMDLTIIPEKHRTDENSIYLICIIAQFSKFANAYILNSKKSDIILGNIKSFINAFGKPNTLYSDNGKEF